MSSTLRVLESVKARLAARLPDLAVEYFPDRPSEYRVNQRRGAVLVSYLGSRYGKAQDLEAAVQERRIRLSVTVLLRQLNGTEGGIAAVDQVRLALLGFKPADCRKCLCLDEKYLGEVGGIWQYAIDFETETVVVEDAELPFGPPLTEVTYEESEA